MPYLMCLEKAAVCMGSCAGTQIMIMQNRVEARRSDRPVHTHL